MLTQLHKTPWPYFGGKADAAPAVWAALGDCDHYVEPFAGSLAVLLRRPHVANRTYHSETVNDMDGLLVNAWRAIQLSPDATAEAASWPVSEADMHARHLAILRWRREHELERLMGDPHWHDPVIAGWWIWGTSCWIGSGWCSGRGPWIVGADGRIAKREKAKAGEGVSRQLPHLANDGRGVNHPQAREEGVSRQLPHLANNGRGVNHPQAREEGVGRDENHGYHPLTMPEIRRWFAFLSARLRHVRILNGDWQRATTGGALQTLPVRQGGACGLFLDPPYRTSDTRAADLYAHDDGDRISSDVRAWCLENGHHKWLRCVLAGFAGEGHEELERHGWTAVEWYSKGFLKGGMANQGDNTQQHKERLWLSPHCLRPATQSQLSLLGDP